MTVLRLAAPADAGRISAIFTASRALLRFLPRLHTADEDRAFIAGHILSRYRVTVAETDGEIAG